MRLMTRMSDSGPITVGLVHGLGASGATWQPLIDRMIADGRFTVTAVDLRGHGDSARASSYGLEALADDLVESLPAGLHCLVGHSLGGSVLVRAVARLAPERAVYLDPGFQLALPTTGLAGRLFWTVPLLSLGVAQALRARRSAAATPLGADARALVEQAGAQFDRRMAVGVFRDVAFHPLAAAAPAVPSTLVLSDESPSVVSDDLVAALEQLGWGVRRLPGLHHDLHLEDADRTFEALRDLL
ncbi:alpha/beta fold hydrolase [Rathayibacter sp. ZW T2_19]|uniref:Alpha/beta fold hydrolase n=1 Tax=Rathayibacter rubneri TaxID=2950106 RepID=A0A9X2DWJ1_9MICO|nr:alpha/beta hydrolase [Rathayibacter rubneri]MCM6761541.1 alpha/beta fold hydrolase [Rathayibacter rubneri]